MADSRLPTDSLSLRREKKIGAYLVGNIIGKGGFGSVYKALDQQAHFVAIKQLSVHGLGAPGPRGGRDVVHHGVLSSGDLGSIEMEISLLSKLRHRNIVKYIESIRTEHHLNIVLEFVEGGSLAGILKKFGAFPESLCAIYTLQILKGLKYLHSQGVIHCDIKGANVLTTKTGLVKLADFGVATKLSEVDSTKRRVVGTPYWMAPEIVEMSPPTPACDIWSVGSTVVEMRTEMPPYADLQQVSAMYHIVSDPHPPVPEGVTQSLELFLLNCFVKDPLQRASAGDLVEHEWIVTNKQQTMEFNRKMKSPAVEQVEEDVDEEPEEELELIGTITTLMGTMTEPALGGGVESVPVADVSTSRQSAGVDASSQGTTRLASVSIPQASSLLDSDGGPEGAAATAPVASASAEVATEGEVATVAAIRAVSASQDSRNLQEYHFAFLDYFHKHMAAAAAQQHSTGTGASDSNSVDRQAPLVDVSRTKSAPVAAGSTTTATATPGTAVAVAALSASDGEQPTLPSQPPPQGPASPEASAHHHQEPGTAAAARGGEATPLPPAPLQPGDSTPLPPPLALERSPGDPALLALGKERQRVAAEIKQLLGSIRPFEEPDVLVGICKRLTELLSQGGSRENSNLHLVMQHGAVPIVEMLQVTDPTLLPSVLKVVNQIVDGNQSFQETFAMVGLIPGVIKFARPNHPRPLRLEAACFIFCLCNTSARSLQMLVACGGLEALVDLLSHNYYHNRDLVWLALDALSKVFESASDNNQKGDFCRILSKHGLCGHLCLLVDTLAGDTLHERASHYLEVVVNMLLFFAKEGDAVVKVYMAKPAILEGLIASLEFLPPELAIQVCKTFKWLAQEPSALNLLENAGVVPVLTCFLSTVIAAGTAGTAGMAGAEACEPTRGAGAGAGPGAGAGAGTGAGGQAAQGAQAAQAAQSQDTCSQCLLALFYLCKLSRPRQEQAALAGVIPLLQELVEKHHSLRVYAFVMLCDMTCASLATRRILWSQGGLAFLVRCLSAPELGTFALEALVGWLGVREHRADWCERMQGLLLSEVDFLRNLLMLFQSERATVFMKILDPLLKLARISKQINAALAASDDFIMELIQRLKGGSSAMDAAGAVSSGDSTPTTGDGHALALTRPGAEGQFTSPLDSIRRTFGSGSGPVPSSAPSVRRFSSFGGPIAAADDAVRARTSLLRLLLLLCQAQEREQLAKLCHVYRLHALMHHVLLEEKRSKRVILCEIASQLLDLFNKASPEECTNTNTNPHASANTIPNPNANANTNANTNVNINTHG